MPAEIIAIVLADSKNFSAMNKYYETNGSKQATNWTEWKGRETISVEIFRSNHGYICV